MARPEKTNTDSSAHLGFAAKLWPAADKLRNNMGAAEYKHVVLGLIGSTQLAAFSPPPLGGERAGVRGGFHRSFDLLGRVFEYFLTQFASAERSDNLPIRRIPRRPAPQGRGSINQSPDL